MQDQRNPFAVGFRDREHKADNRHMFRTERIDRIISFDFGEREREFVRFILFKRHFGNSDGCD
jgi:hypothetical protein